MTVTRNNTNAGNVTTFAAIGIGKFFERSSDSQLYVKLDEAIARKVDDDAQNYSMEPSEGAVLVAAANINVTYDP